MVLGLGFGPALHVSYHSLRGPIVSERLTLSIDAMGGDNAPEMTIEAVDLAARKYPFVDFLLFGDEAKITPALNRFAQAKLVSQIRHTEDIVPNDQKPAIALRQGRASSMRLAINAVHDGEASGIVSAGNTGALMAMAKFVLKMLPGIDRPAIATYIPTEKNNVVMLDLGANIVCTAQNLVQFAVMGEVFARQFFGTDKPSIGILNVGEEETKGNESVRDAAAILQNADLPIHFYGFVEGNDIAKGTVDVIVTDGFTGNVALKVMEGTARLIAGGMKSALKGSLLGWIGALIAYPALRKFRKRFDPRLYNGAMFLGLNGICVKSHGGTDPVGFANAIGVAIELVQDGVIEGIKEDYSHINLEAAASGADAANKS